MMNFVRSRHTFSNQVRRYPARTTVPHLQAKAPIPADGNTSAKMRISRPIPSNDRTTKDWTTIAWPTNIQSKTPDGKFGPAKMMDNWSDCWFLAPLGAVANDPNGHTILAQSIKRVTVEGIDGYHVTFKGSPSKNIFISNAELQQLLDTQGGDADTRLIELAADKFFKERGNYKSLYIATLIKGGLKQEWAEQCFQDYCQGKGLQDPMTHNPMRVGGPPVLAFFMLTGKYSDSMIAKIGKTIQKDDVMMFLNKYFNKDRNAASIVIGGRENPLGDGPDAQDLVGFWDVLRTEITSNGMEDQQEKTFLNALDKFLETRNSHNLEALESAAGNLTLEHMDPVAFVYQLSNNISYMHQNHFNLLRSAVREVLDGGRGYIGFLGDHFGIIEGFNAATGTFTYSEPNYPTLVHTGELSHLIQAIKNKNAWLSAVEPTTGQDEAESSHAGEKRGRHLLESHQQAVRDGKIDSAESGPLANLMEMDDGAFWQEYDRDTNGVIEGGELNAVQLQVDQWVDHFKLTPIW